MANNDTDNHINRAQLAETFGVSLPTVDAWIRKGCPYVQKGGNGKPWQFRIQEVVRWREKMARESDQSWKGGHVKATHSASNPELAALMEQRPDLENPLRFFIEDGLRHFLEYWMSTYPWIIIEQLHKETGDKEKAVTLLQAAMGHVLGIAGVWVIEDQYNKSMEGRDSLDAIWRDVSGFAIPDTAPPNTPEQLLFSNRLPRLLAMEPHDFVAAYWQDDMPVAEGLIPVNLEPEAKHE